jgi:cyclase
MSTSLHDHASIEAAEVADLGGGLYAYIQPDGSWMINNTGFLVGREGVTVVDSCSTERRTRAFRDAVTGVSPNPIRVLVNTHSHPDHTTGNALFGEAAIVAHEATRTEVLAGLPPVHHIWEPFDPGTLPVAPPFLTYTEGVTLWVDDLKCEVRFVGTPAHTTNDSIIWVPERSVLYAGDLLFNGGTPFLMSGSIAGAIKALTEEVAPLGAATIVPGHGPICGPEVIDTVLGYLRFVQATAEKAKAAGLSPLEAARETDLGEYAGWTDTERIVGNLHRAYSELDGNPLGAPMNFDQVLQDMVTYNGGKLLTCLA